MEMKRSLFKLWTHNVTQVGYGEYVQCD